MTVLLQRMIRDRLRRARPEKIFNAFKRIRFRFSQVCGLASSHTAFPSSHTAMSDGIPVQVLVGGIARNLNPSVKCETGSGR